MMNYFSPIYAKSWKTSAMLMLRKRLHDAGTLERLGFFYNLVCLNSSTP